MKKKKVNICRNNMLTSCFYSGLLKSLPPTSRLVILTAWVSWPIFFHCTLLFKFFVCVCVCVVYTCQSCHRFFSFSSPRRLLTEHLFFWYRAIVKANTGVKNLSVICLLHQVLHCETCPCYCLQRQQAS